MSFQINTEKRDGYLYITVTGKNLPGNVEGYLYRVNELCTEHKCPNVLIVENLTGPGLSPFEIYNLISRSSERARAIHHIAFVDINPEHSRANMHFAEDVAANRGIRIQVFATVQGAEEWMESAVK